MAFGPDATWDDTPRPLGDAGFTVIANSDRLAAIIANLVDDGAGHAEYDATADNCVGYPRCLNGATQRNNDKTGF